MNVSRNTALDVFTSLALFHSFFVYVTGLERMFQCFCILLLLPYVFLHARVLFAKCFRTVNVLSLLYALWIILSSYLSRRVAFYERTASFVAVSVVAVGFVAALIVIESFIKRRKILLCLRVFYVCALLYLVFSLVQLLFKGSISNGAGYIIGTKFQVSYLSVVLAGLFYCVGDRRKPSFYSVLAIHIAAAMLISIVVQCSTSIVGILVFVLVLALPSFSLFCRKPAAVVLALIICDTILIVSQAVLEVPAISYVIETILNEDLTLTSRTSIYTELPFVFEGMPLSGYGYGNSYAVCHPVIGAPNTQNGLLDCLVQTGLPGLVLSLSICFFAFWNCSTKRWNRGILAIVWFYIFVSSVEITFDLQFLLFSIMMMNYVETNYKENKTNLPGIKFGKIRVRFA